MGKYFGDFIRYGLFYGLKLATKIIQLLDYLLPRLNHVNIPLQIIVMLFIICNADFFCRTKSISFKFIELILTFYCYGLK